MESIMTTEKGVCYICGRYGQTEVHHVFHGTANRKIADREGLTVNLCRACHERVHRDAELNRNLEREAQEVWETKRGTRAEFMKLFGKNYR